MRRQQAVRQVHEDQSVAISTPTRLLPRLLRPADSRLSRSQIVQSEDETVRWSAACCEYRFPPVDMDMDSMPSLSEAHDSGPGFVGIQFCQEW